MYKKYIVCVTILCLIVILTSCNVDDNEVGIHNPHDISKAWVVINEMNDFPGDEQDININYANTEMLVSMFEKIGVSKDHINIVNGRLDRDRVIKSIDWLMTNSKKGDTIFYYIGAHGSWINNELDWHESILKDWISVNDRQKVMIVDACGAGSFIQGVQNLDNNGMYAGVVASNEIAWWGIEEEGLPIIGSVWLSYFTKAVFNDEADTDSNGEITFTEAFNHTKKGNQNYMYNEVFKVPEFLQIYNDGGIYPSKLDTYPNPVLYDNINGDLVLYKIKQ